MSNHARGLWGYSGKTASGLELTIQATGMGGPSAALVLADLAKLGVRRAVRVGTCTAVAGRSRLGDLLVVGKAVAGGGSSTSFGLDAGDMVTPDPALLAGLERAPGSKMKAAIIASLDTTEAGMDELPDTVAAADMQTVAVLARGAQLNMATAAVVIVSDASGERLSDEQLEATTRRAGHVALGGLSR